MQQSSLKIRQTFRFIATLLVLCSFIEILPVFCSFSSIASATESRSIYGSYSNMFYHDEAGDILGYELTLFSSKAGDYALFQESEGWPATPQLVPVTIRNNALEFTIESLAGRNQRVQGTIKPNAVQLQLSPSYTVTLPKSESYWFFKRDGVTYFGLYSNIQTGTNATSGTSYELFIVGTSQEEYIVYREHTGSSYSVPILLPLKTNTSKGGAELRFSIPKENKPAETFVGSVTQNGIHGMFQNTGKLVNLKRVFAFQP